MYKQAEPIVDGVISSSNAICPSMGLRESQNSCRKKYSIGSQGDSLMTQLHCDILPPKRKAFPQAFMEKFRNFENFKKN